MMQNLETNYDHFNDHSNHKRKAEPPSGSESNDVLWPENDGKKIWTGRKYSGTPAKYVKYKKEEDEVKALMGLIHEEGVAEVVATEEKNVNMNKSVTMEHCFKNEGKQKTAKKRKTQAKIASLYFQGQKKVFPPRSRREGGFVADDVALCNR